MKPITWMAVGALVASAGSAAQAAEKDTSFALSFMAPKASVTQAGNTYSFLADNAVIFQSHGEGASTLTAGWASPTLSLVYSADTGAYDLTISSHGSVVYSSTGKADSGKSLPGMISAKGTASALGTTIADTSTFTLGAVSSIGKVTLLKSSTPTAPIGVNVYGRLNDTPVAPVPEFGTLTSLGAMSVAGGLPLIWRRRSR